ncbi:pirin family protein [Paenibacillus sepulcri]|uniref:Pirin family protein n=2 Tax=Paenibacillus sepulcri TaxID=359917 RepID=A0ABS7BXR5_9BACL|nr:pirin family protein [Paenibacillus sepulcri]
MTIKIYPPEQQDDSWFDGTNIRVQKPIGFPQENSVVQRVGPLFYWSWAHTKEKGGIGLHPHRGFEIMSYVINGQLTHGDTLGTKSTIGPGGVQVMQTGSGVSHQEEVQGPDAESFQIWLEPYLSEAMKRTPTYRDYRNEDFPVTAPAQGVSRKTLIGEGAPIQLVTDVKMWDITVAQGQAYQHVIPAGYSWAALAVRGGGTWENMNPENEPVLFHHKDFSVIEATGNNKSIGLRADRDSNVRMFAIELPTTVDYPLYQR